MSDVIIRPVTQADKTAFWALRLEALKTNPESFGADYENTLRTHTIESYAERIPDTESDNVIFCAELEGELLGMMGFYRETRPKTKHSGGIWGVFAKPEYRGRGIGKKLMQAIMNHVHQCDGLTRVTLSVITENQAAIKLYEKFGFTIWGIQPDALRVGNQSYAMHWMSYQIR